MTERKERKRFYTWFIEPLNDFTNRVIVEQILQDAEDSITQRALCQDGISRDLYAVSYVIVKRVIASRLSLSLSFNIFIREGKMGKIRSADLLFERRNNKKKIV